MKILIIGCGGREHAIALKLSQSKLKPELYCIGNYYNPGIYELCKEGGYHIAMDTTPDISNLVRIGGNPDLAIIGPEKYLERGWADHLRALDIPVVGPNSDQAKIETSKAYCRVLLDSNGMKEYQPNFIVVQKSTNNILNEQAIDAALIKFNNNVVVKADGLAGGKGVKVFGDHFDNMQQAKDYAVEVLNSDGCVVFEEKLDGREFSLMSMTDGGSFVHFPLVQDYKRAYDKNRGPNTGGMGSLSLSNGRLPGISEDDVEIAKKLNESTVKIINRTTKKPYRGIIYGGYMKTRDKKIKIIEYNSRFGDPECINVLAVLDSDFAELCLHAASGTLRPKLYAKFQRKHTLCKYIVPENYPNASESNTEIVIPKSSMPDDVTVIYASLGYSPTNGAVIPESKELENYETPKEQNKFYMYGSRTAAFVCASGDLLKIGKLVDESIRQCKGKFRYRTDIGPVSAVQIDFSKKNDQNNVKFPKDHPNRVIVTLKKYPTNPTNTMNSPPTNTKHQTGETTQKPPKNTNDTSNKISDEGIAMSAYEQAGVNINEGVNTVHKIQKYVEKTYNDSVKSNFGDFAGIMEIDKPCHLVFSTDGVGTKNEVVLDYYGIKGYTSLGMDIVNHCINDTLVKGAMPFAFLDYYGCSELDSDAVKYLVKGASKACEAAGCVLIGGETAEMPGTYHSNKSDIVGTMIGRVQPRGIIDGKMNIRPGDVVMALPSDSPHTNGYSLIRKVLADNPELKEDKYFMEEICRPHRSYLKEIKLLTECHPNDIPIHGLCHITGGGFVDNPDRVLPDNCKIDFVDWKWPSIYRKIMRYGGVSKKEMLRVFNCGVGMLIVVPKEAAPKLNVLFFDVFKVGDVVEVVDKTI